MRHLMDGLELVLLFSFIFFVWIGLIVSKIMIFLLEKVQDTLFGIASYLQDK
jgi:hypothetical protein